MAPVTVYIHYNGEIIFCGDYGVQYEGMHMKIIRVKQGISFKKLRRKIFSALELDHHSNVITITFCCPQEILSQRVVYMPIPMSLLLKRQFHAIYFFYYFFF